MGAVGGLRCFACHAEAGAVPSSWRCTACGELLEWMGTSGGVEDAEEWKHRWRQRRLGAAANDQSGVWRFREILPAPALFGEAVTLREGNAPLYTAPQSGAWAGLPQLQVKNLGMNPTGSFKDAGMTVAVSHARAQGYRWLACASTGNTSASMAAYAARAGLFSLVLVPSGKISSSKLAQALDYGALTCEIRTDFDGCFALLREIAIRTNLYVVNSINPFRIEGQKTVAAELLEELDWRAPDHVLVPGGNLANASALGKGFLELRDWGFADRVPKVSIVQAAGANPLVTAMRAHGGKSLEPMRAQTLATAIRIGNPASWKKAVQVLAQTGGHCLDVTEEEIAQAKASIGRDGIGCEPASAAAVAGARRLASQGLIGRDETVVAVLTGNVLKDPDYVLAYQRGEVAQVAGAPARTLGAAVDANVDAVLQVMEEYGRSV
ncbi:MAG: threonine synthase [Terriglobales bacterium]